MTNISRIASVVVLALLQTACASAIEVNHAAPKRILFVGNSYLYYNDSLHNHVKRIAENSGPFTSEDYQYKSATISGSRLSHHNIDSLLEPGRLGIDEAFELVILQGGSMEPLTEENRKAFAAQVAEMGDKISASGAKVALYMTHAYVPPHKKFDPDMIERIESIYVQTGEAIGAQVLPVGLAFDRAYEERPDIILHKTFDGSHPSMLGSYLAACVVYASIYNVPATEIEYDYFGEVSPDDAAFLRRIAAETIAEFGK